MRPSPPPPGRHHRDDEQAASTNQVLEAANDHQDDEGRPGQPLERPPARSRAGDVPAASTSTSERRRATSVEHGQVGRVTARAPGGGGQRHPGDDQATSHEEGLRAAADRAGQRWRLARRAPGRRAAAGALEATGPWPGCPVRRSFGGPSAPRRGHAKGRGLARSPPERARHGRAALAGPPARRRLPAPPGAEPRARRARPGVGVASFNFPESRLIAEIYAQALEDEGVAVRRELDLGPGAGDARLRQGLVDVVPEYLGTALIAADPGAAVDGPTPAAVRRRSLVGRRALGAPAAPRPPPRTRTPWWSPPPPPSACRWTPSATWPRRRRR